MTTVTISEALKNELEAIRDTEEHGSLNETILCVLRNPLTGERPVSGPDETLTEPVKITEFTRHVLQRIRDNEGHTDYEAVIRARAGIEPRDHGERPIELEPLS